MCGRYGFTKPEKLKAQFLTDNELVNFKPRYNIAPSQTLPVIVHENNNHIEMMRWGLIPYWAKDMSVGYKMINARAESVAEKPSYKKSLSMRRCLVPATGFIEWKTTKEGKIPFYFQLKNEDVFAFAGLFDVWHDTEGKEIRSYTIITTDANAIVEPIHERMPVMLTKEKERTWLDPDITEPERLLPLLTPFDAEEMKTHAISPEINKPANDYANLLSPVVNSK